MSDMRIVHHGGMCCGIKTIHGLGTSPDGEYEGHVCEAINGFEHKQVDQYDQVVPLSEEFTEDPVEYIDADVTYSVVNSWTNIFSGKAPEESPRARLKRYIDWIAKKRPSHLVEICLQVSGVCNQKAWIPVLEEYGFKMVTEFYNSNSGNRVGIFHLVLLRGKPEGDK